MSWLHVSLLWQYCRSTLTGTLVSRVQGTTFVQVVGDTESIISLTRSVKKKKIRGQLLGFSPGPQSLFLGNQRWCAADVCGPRRTSGIETSLCLRRTPSRPRTTEWEVLSAPPLYKWPLTSAGAAGCPGFRTPAKKQTHTIKSAHNQGTVVCNCPLEQQSLERLSLTIVSSS